MLFVTGALMSLAVSVAAGIPEGWRYATPLPQGATLRAAWAAGPDDVFVGGESGVVLRWNGTRWTSLNPPTQKTIFALHGTSSTDVWAVGGDPYAFAAKDRHLLLHFNGSTWKEFTAPTFGDSTYVANAVHALAPDDVWVCIDGGTWLQHYDGRSWDWVSVPLAVEGSLRGLGSTGPDHLFVVGSHGQILHRDRGTWKLEQQTETGSWSANLLSAVWAPDLDHVLVGGTWGQVFARNPDGSWTDRGLRGQGTFSDSTLAFGGTPSGEVLLLGSVTVRQTSGHPPVAEHDFGQRLRRSWIAGAATGNRLYAVGSHGVVHEIQAGPTGQPPVVVPLTVGDSRPLSCVPQGALPLDRDAVLLWGASYQFQNAWPLLRYQEGRFEPWPLPEGMTPNDAIVSAAWGTHPTNLVIGWHHLQSFGRGVHRWDGRQWTALGPWFQTPFNLVALGQAGTGPLWACSPTLVSRWQDNTWETVLAVPDDAAGRTNFSALACRQPSEVFVGTQEGVIFRFHDGRWSQETLPAPARAMGIAGSDIYAVGAGGVAWRRAASGWQTLAGLEAREGDDFTHLVVAREGVFAAQVTPSGFTGGGLSRLWRFEGTQARRWIQGIPRLQALGTDTEGHVHAIADRDVVLTDRPPVDTTLVRVNLAAGDWTALGATGVALRSPAPQPNPPEVMVAARSLTAATDDTAPELRPGLTGAGPQWVLAAESFFAGSVLSNVLVRFTLDPAALDPAFPLAHATLFRSDGTGWHEVPTTVEGPSGSLTSPATVATGLWTFAAIEPVSPPTLVIAQVDPTRIELRWPAGPAGWVLESSPILGPGATWTAAPEPAVVEGDTKKAIVTPTEATRFFRLR